MTERTQAEKDEEYQRMLDEYETLREEYYNKKPDIHDVTWLFRIAQDWLVSSPGELIPIDLWDKKVVEAGITDSAPAGVFVGDCAIYKLNTNLIPALAAISLGNTSSEVQKSLAHHGGDYKALLECEFFHDLNDDHRKSVIPSDFDNTRLNKYLVSNEIIKAMASNPTSLELLVSQSIENESSNEATLAKLQINEPRLWPITYIENLFNKPGNHVSTDIPKNIYTEFSRITSTLRDVLPTIGHVDKSIVVDIIERSGALHLQSGREETYFNHELFSRSFNEIKNNPRNYELVFGAINAEERPGKVLLIANKIYDTMMRMDGGDFSFGISAIESMHLVLDPIKYAKILESTIIKVNARPIDYISSNKLKLDAGFEILAGDQDFLPGTNLPVESILSGVINEIMSVPANEISFSHLRSIYKCTQLSIKQTFDGKQINELIVHLANGADTYIEKHKNQPPRSGWDPAYKIANYFAEKAFISLASVCEPDYEMFNSISSKWKVALVAGGLDIKKMKGLDLKDRGRVLESGLGL